MHRRRRPGRRPRQDTPRSLNSRHRCDGDRHRNGTQPAQGLEAVRERAGGCTFCVLRGVEPSGLLFPGSNHPGPMAVRHINNTGQNVTGATVHRRSCMLIFAAIGLPSASRNLSQNQRTWQPTALGVRGTTNVHLHSRRVVFFDFSNSESIGRHGALSGRPWHRPPRRVRAEVAPIPELAPVMTTTFPTRLDTTSLYVHRAIAGFVALFKR